MDQDQNQLEDEGDDFLEMDVDSNINVEMTRVEFDLGVSQVEPQKTQTRIPAVTSLNEMDPLGSFAEELAALSSLKLTVRTIDGKYLAMKRQSRCKIRIPSTVLIKSSFDSKKNSTEHIAKIKSRQKFIDKKTKLMFQHNRIR